MYQSIRITHAELSMIRPISRFWHRKSRRLYRFDAPLKLAFRSILDSRFFFCADILMRFSLHLQGKWYWRSHDVVKPEVQGRTWKEICQKFFFFQWQSHQKDLKQGQKRNVWWYEILRVVKYKTTKNRLVL